MPCRQRPPKHRRCAAYPSQTKYGRRFFIGKGRHTTPLSAAAPPRNLHARRHELGGELYMSVRTRMRAMVNIRGVRACFCRRCTRCLGVRICCVCDRFHPPPIRLIRISARMRCTCFQRTRVRRSGSSVCAHAVLPLRHTHDPSPCSSAVMFMPTIPTTPIHLQDKPQQCGNVTPVAPFPHVTRR